MSLSYMQLLLVPLAALLVGFVVLATHKANKFNYVFEITRSKSITQQLDHAENMAIMAALLEQEMSRIDSYLNQMVNRPPDLDSGKAALVKTINLTGSFRGKMKPSFHDALNEKSESELQKLNIDNFNLAYAKITMALAAIEHQSNTISDIINGKSKIYDIPKRENDSSKSRIV